MKYLFGRNITKESKSDVPDGQQYLIADLPEALADKLAQAEYAEERAERRSKLPMVFSVIKYICLFIGFTFGAGILRGSVSLAQGYRNAPYLYWITGVCLIVGGLLWLIGRSREKHLDERAPVRAARRAQREAERGADAYLSVPEHTKTADVLLVEYFIREGEPVCKGPAWLSAMRLYCQDNTLCLTDGTTVFAIEKDKLSALRLVERNTAILGWNKEDNPAQNRFQKAGLYLKKQTPAGLRFYCALEWIDDSEVWQLLFPAYELSKITSLTGLKAPTLPVLPQEKKSPAPTKRHDGKVRPRFYWAVPKEENVGFWFSELSDIEFQMAHPKLYQVLVVIGVLLLVLPMLVFTMAATFSRPETSNNLWLLLGGAGGFVMGIGLFNIVGAWIEQYMGHWVTIICIGLGAAMMIASWLLMA